MTDKPVYIIGSTPLACYLAAKFSDKGKNITLIAGKKDNYSLSTNGFTLKEDQSLSKKKYKINTSFWLKEPAGLVILAASPAEINALSTTISPQKIIDAPVLCFTQINDKSYLETFFKQPLIPAFFEGFLQRNDQTVTLLGRSPQIIIDENVSKKKQALLQEYMEGAGIPCIYESDSSLCFWRHFIPYALGSLAAAAYNQNLGQIIKNKQYREDLRICTEEAVSLSGCPDLSCEEIVKKLHLTPNSYQYPLQKELTSSSGQELEAISAPLRARLREEGRKGSKLEGLMDKVYNIILA